MTRTFDPNSLPEYESGNPYGQTLPTQYIAERFNMPRWYVDAIMETVLNQRLIRSSSQVWDNQRFYGRKSELLALQSRFADSVQVYNACKRVVAELEELAIKDRQNGIKPH